jgi:hypothetical protein
MNIQPKLLSELLRTFIRRTHMRMWMPMFGMLLFVCLFGYYVYANYIDSITTAETIHVLPLSITHSRWSHIETLYIQDLPESALYQSFSPKNSAYLEKDTTIPQDISTPDGNNESGGSTTVEANGDENGIESEPGDATHDSSSSTTTTTPVIAPSALPPELLNKPESLPTTETSTEQNKEDAPSELQSEERDPAPASSAKPEAPPDPTQTTEQSIEHTAPTKTPSDPLSVLVPVHEQLTFALATEVVTTTDAVAPPIDAVENTPSVVEPVAPPEAVVSQREDESSPDRRDEDVAPSVETTTPSRGDDITTSTTPLSTSTLSTTTTTDIATASSTPLTTQLQISTRVIPPGSPTLTWKGFSLPALAQTETIDTAQIRVSLGARLTDSAREQNRASTLLLQYSFDENTWADAGSIVITDETSNALNGGYFLFALPPIIDPTLLRDLSLRAIYLGDTRDVEALYIDSAWIELSARTLNRDALESRVSPESLTELDKPLFHELVSDEIDFTDSEMPHFELAYHEQRNIAVQMVRKVFSSKTATLEDVSVIHRDVGELSIDPVLTETADGTWEITLPESAREELRPGTYTLELTVREGSVRFVDRLEFQWGLMAINTDQNRYGVGESVSITLAALSPNGNTLCDASLELYLIDQANFIRRLPVSLSGACNGNNVVDVPDYSSVVTALTPGTYELYVEHIDPQSGNARAHTNTTFVVVEAPTFTLARSGPTRIYPVSPYEMRLTLTASTTMRGELVERLPTDYTIISTNGTAMVSEQEHTISLPFSLSEGESTTLTYVFDSPDISPYLYTLGPASVAFESTMPISTSAPNATSTMSRTEVVDDSSTTTTQTTVAEGSLENEDTQHTQQSSVDTYTEHTRWQIASDATGSMIIYLAATTTPVGWTCVSCAATSTFYQRFVRGSDVYGSTSGATTMTHTAYGIVSQTATAANSENRAGTNVSDKCIVIH